MFICTDRKRSLHFPLVGSGTGPPRLNWNDAPEKEFKNSIQTIPQIGAVTLLGHENLLENEKADQHR